MAQFGSDKRDSYLEKLREGARRMTAAEAVGVSYSIVWRAPAVKRVELPATTSRMDMGEHEVSRPETVFLTRRLWVRFPRDPPVRSWRTY